MITVSRRIATRTMGVVTWKAMVRVKETCVVGDWMRCIVHCVTSEASRELSMMGVKEGEGKGREEISKT